MFSEASTSTPLDSLNNCLRLSCAVVALIDFNATSKFLEQSEIPNIKSASREVNQDLQAAQSSASKPTLKGASNSQVV